MKILGRQFTCELLGVTQNWVEVGKEGEWGSSVSESKKKNENFEAAWVISSCLRTKMIIGWEGTL